MPPMKISEGTTELVKMLAVCLMTADHINKYLLYSSAPLLYGIGRLAMPLFLIVLSYNLSRPQVCGKAAHLRTATRIAAAGVVATPAYIALGGVTWGWWPLNIMYMLFAVAVSTYLIETGRSGLAAAVVLVFGAFSEYFWPAIGIGIAMWSYWKRPSWWAAASGLCCGVLLCFLNGNLWALSALPAFVIIAQIAKRLPVNPPRMKMVYYAYYPLHLLTIVVIGKLF